MTVNNFPSDSGDELAQQILKQFSYFTEKKILFLGIGPEVQGILHLKSAFRRAQIASKMAMQTRQKVVDFNEMGFFKLCNTFTSLGSLEKGTNPISALFRGYRSFTADLYPTAG